MSNPVRLTANKNIPAIQQPNIDPASLASAMVGVKQAVETLGGQRGPIEGRAVTFTDLVNLGLITISNGLATTVGTGATTDAGTATTGSTALAAPGLGLSWGGPDVPETSAFTQTNFGPTTSFTAIADGPLVLTETSSNSGGADSLRLISVPRGASATMTLTVLLTWTINPTNVCILYPACAISAAGKISAIHVEPYRDWLTVDDLSSTNAWNHSPIGNLTLHELMPVGEGWFRIADDGTNLTYSYSTDGVNFTVLYTSARLAWLDSIAAFGVAVDAAAAAPCTAVIWSFTAE